MALRYVQRVQTENFSRIISPVLDMGSSASHRRRFLRAIVRVRCVQKITFIRGGFQRASGICDSLMILETV